ncbi:MAG: hypothetical protein Q4E65_09195 [Clostridia bacterium]|nr:hypothetical protein [Clostridia bacterium]
MRKHEKELEDQLSAKVKELTDKENALQALTQEMNGLKSQLQQQETRIMAYQEREGALVAAMTQVEALSKNRLAETEAQVQTLLSGARQEADTLLSTTKEQADNALAQAEQQAAATLAQAKEQALGMLMQAETAAKEHNSNTQMLNAQLATAAKQAREQLASLDAWMRRTLVFTDNAAQLEEIQSMKDALLAPEVETPEAYANPAELMQSIYAIEGRELPGQECEPIQEPAEDEPAQEPAEEEAAPERAWEEQAAEEPEAAPLPMPDVPAAEANAAPEAEEAPRMWTVDEIVASVIDGELPGAEADSDTYLKQLIDDILQ